MGHANKQAIALGKPREVEGCRRADVVTEITKIAAKTSEQSFASLECCLRAREQNLRDPRIDVGRTALNSAVDVIDAAALQSGLRLARLPGCPGTELNYSPAGQMRSNVLALQDLSRHDVAVNADHGNWTGLPGSKP